jgi:uncharacterized membrane protein YedE/YeeE
VIELLSQRWPWWIAGPLIGLIVPLLLLYGGRLFGISSSLRHVCAATVPGRLPFFRYDWRSQGAWNLAFVAGLVLGGALAGTLLAADDASVGISDETWHDLGALGIARQDGLAPAEIFDWDRVATTAGFVSLVLGGFLLGFGARWAGGCTSGHAISGLADRQLPSLVAVIGFFVGGLLATHLLWPLLLSGGGHG